MAGKNRPLMSELNWQNGFASGEPVTVGFLHVGMLPQHQHIPALQPSTQCPMCSAEDTQMSSVRPVYTRLGARFISSSTPINPEIAAAIREEAIVACAKLGEERNRLRVEHLTIQKSRSDGILSLGDIVFADYAELELRAAASMTPEQIAAMRQENDDESNHP